MNIINEFFVSFILIKLYFKFKVCRKIKFPLLWKFYFSKWKFYFSADNNTKKLDTIEIFNIPDLSKHKKILLIDDIVDSGESLAEIKKVLLEKFPHIELKITTIFYKKTALLEPDFKVKEATEWVDFYWDINLD